MHSLHLCITAGATLACCRTCRASCRPRNRAIPSQNAHCLRARGRAPTLKQLAARPTAICQSKPRNPPEKSPPDRRQPVRSLQDGSWPYTDPGHTALSRKHIPNPQRPAAQPARSVTLQQRAVGALIPLAASYQPRPRHCDPCMHVRISPYADRPSYCFHPTRCCPVQKHSSLLLLNGQNPLQRQSLACPASAG